MKDLTGAKEMLKKILSVVINGIRKKTPFAIFAYEINHYVNILIPKFYNGLDGRYYRFIYCLHRTSNLSGAVAELGTGTGRGTAYIVSLMSKLNGDRQFFAFDTFEGFPSISERDLEGVSEWRKKKVSVVGHYRGYGQDHIERVIKGAQKSANNVPYMLVPGDVCQTVYKIPAEQEFSFVFIDLDLYEGYRASLDALYSKVQRGGIILFDEYQFPDEWPGAKRAVDEFLEDKPESLQFFPYDGSAYIVKV